MFMVSAAVFVILIEHPALPIRNTIESPLYRRLLIGFAMGVTAVLLIYSAWGKRSGAHMNPAVTLTFLQLDRIKLSDAIWYIIAQFVGGVLAIWIIKLLLTEYLEDTTVNYVATVPGKEGIWIALGLETLLSFVLFLIVLISSNSSRFAPYTGYIVGVLLTLFIGFEAPYSGMSMNPARTVASALPSGIWSAWWIYFVGPVIGMQIAGWLYRKWYRITHNDNCLTMDCHLSGEKHDCPTYEVLGPKDLIEKYGT